MKRIESNLIGIEQGEVALFSEFQDGGSMWTGEGRRERSQTVRFSEAFLAAPAVQLAVSLWDVDTSAPIRAELAAQNVTPEGFEIVFRTWSDTRVARIRVAWTAMGALAHKDDWQL